MPGAHQPMDTQQLHSGYSRPSSGFSRRSQDLPPTPTASGRLQLTPSLAAWLQGLVGYRMYLVGGAVSRTRVTGSHI